jgi:CRP/FNR family transcriptional regulator, nitrogen fixation regulation protein
VNTRSFPPDAQIYRAGDPANYLYKIVTGAVRTSRVSLEGRRQIGGFFLSGELFGLEPGAQHIFSSETISETHVLVIERTGLASSELLDLMHHELRRAQNHSLLLMMTASERVATFLLEMAERIHSGGEVQLPMSRLDIADHLGLAIETVSRTLTELEKHSAIALPASRRIVLRNPAALKQLVSGNQRR